MIVYFGVVTLYFISIDLRISCTATTIDPEERRHQCIAHQKSVVDSVPAICSLGNQEHKNEAYTACTFILFVERMEAKIVGTQGLSVPLSVLSRILTCIIKYV